MVKMKATRTTYMHKAGQRIVVNAAMAKALVLLRVAEYEDAEVEEIKPKKRAYKRRDMRAE